MADEPTILLIGLRGSGKTTIGRKLADTLGADFADLDDDVLHRLGADSVADAWRDRGEPAFREAEAAALEERLQSTGSIVALGGGTPTAPGAEDLIRANRDGAARVIYLHALPDILGTRLSYADPNRPPLTGDDPVAEVGRVYDDRNDRYAALADRIVSAEVGPDEVLDEALHAVREWWGRSSGGDQAASE